MTLKVPLWIDQMIDLTTRRRLKQIRMEKKMAPPTTITPMMTPLMKKLIKEKRTTKIVPTTDKGANRGYEWLSVIPAGGNYSRHEIFKAYMVVKETPRGLKVIKNRHNGLTDVYITWHELDILDKWVHI